MLPARQVASKQHWSVVTNGGEGEPSARRGSGTREGGAGPLPCMWRRHITQLYIPPALGTRHDCAQTKQGLMGAILPTAFTLHKIVTHITYTYMHTVFQCNCSSTCVRSRLWRSNTWNSLVHPEPSFELSFLTKEEPGWAGPVGTP